VSAIIGRGRYARETYPAPSGGGAAALAREWADNPQAIGVASAAGSTLASVTITPKVTGKFRVIITGVIFSSVANYFTCRVGHGPIDPVPADYTSGIYQVPVAVTTDGVGFSLVVDLDKIAVPFVFPVGVPVRIAVGGAGNIGGCSISAGGVQIEVQEVF
jgi:hypothetical protein